MRVENTVPGTTKAPADNSNLRVKPVLSPDHERPPTVSTTGVPSSPLGTDHVVSYLVISVLPVSVVHLDVEDFSEELLRCLLCHKEPARRIQSPLLGDLERKKPPTRGFLLAPRWFFMA